MIIAIDGPASSGKGTAARGLAKKMKVRHVDSGSLYRVVAFYVFNMEMDPTNTAAVVNILPKIDIKIEPGEKRDKIISRGRDITDEIRYHLISGISSQVSVIPQVRKWVNNTVRKFAMHESIVAEGRDIGTEVFPDADFKFYLDASLEERARRRHLELKQKGSKITFSEVKRDLAARDQRDKDKEIGKLRLSDDAIYVDSTNLSPVKVIDFMYNKVIQDKDTPKAKKV